MARGWESKSVEEQQAESLADRKPSTPAMTPAQLQRLRQRASLLLARANIIQQLEKAQNPRHRNVLQDALADLDRKLAELG